MRPVVLSLCLSFVLAACGNDASDDRPEVAFVTNGVDPFWDVAAAGAHAAAAEFDVALDVRMPTGGIPDQKAMVEDLLSRGVDGIAISPINPTDQIGLIDEAAARTRVVTHDSDAPGSKRLCYVGMDNYEAGRAAGRLVKEALPQGGSILVLVGRLEQDNARYRRQGVIDELLARERVDGRIDPPEARFMDGRWKIMATLTDQFDRTKAKANVEDTLATTPDLAGVVGLFAYNAPAALAAVRQAGRVGKIAIVSFDEHDETLQGIKDGEIFGTVVQNPYMYGYDSVRILAGLARGRGDVLPEGGVIDHPQRVIGKAEVDAFWADKKTKMAAGR